MQTFRDLERHFASVPASLVDLLTSADRSAGRQQAYAQQHPEQLKGLRQVALIQSAEASNAIENIVAPRRRIEALVNETTEPKNRSEQEIAGYRFALDVLHANARQIDFEPKFVEQIHGYLGRYTGGSTTGHWKGLDNQVEERRPDGTTVVRFVPVSAAATPAAMEELHTLFNHARAAKGYHHLLLTSAYVLDFLVIHPFRDGNGRMARLLTLWLLYLGDYEVGRFISLEKLVEESRDSYYEALQQSTVGWHEGAHDIRPWAGYLLGVINAAYREFDTRTDVVRGRGSKQMLVKRFIATSLSNEFSIQDIRQASPGVGDSTIKRVLAELKKQQIIKPLGRGRGAKYERLRGDFLDGSE